MSERLSDILVWEVRGMDREKKDRVPGYPDGTDDLINKYGTYEVQPTNGEENDFPQIAQGMSWQERARLLGAEALRRHGEV